MPNKYNSGPAHKANEWVDLPLHDLYKLVHGPTSLERSDHIAIIDELLQRVVDAENKYVKEFMKNVVLV